MAKRDRIQLQEPPTAQAPVALAAANDGGRESPAPAPCPVCGGSGSLRLADQRYRTCLDCLGTGSAA